MRLDVRPATIDDADAIALAHIDGWRVGYRHLLPHEFLDAPEFAEVRIEGWRQWRWPAWAPGSVLFAGLIDDEVVGFGHTGPAHGDGAIGEVFGFYLHSRAWGSGIGDLLMQACTDQLRDDGFARAVLWVLRENPRARRFYERHGWQPSGNTDTIATAFGQTLPWPLADVEYAIELANPVK